MRTLRGAGRGKTRVGLSLMHRPKPADNDPQWQEEGILQKSSFELLSPSDREGVMRILIMYDDDTCSAEQVNQELSPAAF
jgi:hypothetical protein